MNVTYVRYRYGHPYVVPAGGWRRKSPIHVSTCSETNKTNEICASRMSGQWRSQRMLWHFFWMFQSRQRTVWKPTTFLVHLHCVDGSNFKSPSPQKVFVLRTCSNMFLSLRTLLFLELRRPFCTLNMCSDRGSVLKAVRGGAPCKHELFWENWQNPNNFPN